MSNAANKAEITLLMEALKAALDARPGGLDKALEDLKAEAKPETGP